MFHQNPAADAELTFQLFEAVRKNHVRAAKAIIRSGANIHAVSPEHGPLISYACSNRRISINLIRYLLRCGADANQKYNEFAPPLHQAMINHRHDIAAELLEFGANLEISDTFRRTPLLRAVAHKDVAGVRFLLLRDADVEAKDPIFERTPFLAAIETLHSCDSPPACRDCKKEEAIFKLLDDCNANYLAVDTWNKNAFHVAASLGHHRIVPYLKQLGIDINARDCDDKSPLDIAAQLYDWKFFHALVNAGANVNAQNAKGETLLMFALKDGDIERWQHLLLIALQDYDLDDSIRDKQGKTFIERMQAFATPTTNVVSNRRAYKTALFLDNYRKRDERRRLYNEKETRQLRAEKRLRQDQFTTNVTAKPLGDGTYAVIRRGLFARQEVAIKTFRSNINESSFYNEVDILASAAADYTDPNAQYIIRLYGYRCGEPFNSNDTFNSLVLEMAWGSLADLIDRTQLGNYPFIIKIADQTAHGLVYLHNAGCTHNDLKPENVLVKLTPLQIRMADLNAAEILTRNPFGMIDYCPCTYKSAPPEFIDRDPPYFCSPQSDMWSYGFTIAELFIRYSFTANYNKPNALPEILRKYESGLRPSIPVDCPAVLSLMLFGCWKQNPMQRLTAQQVVDHLRPSMN